MATRQLSKAEKINTDTDVSVGTAREQSDDQSSTCQDVAQPAEPPT